MRICLVTGEYPPDEGGVADYTACLAAALAARGVAIDVVTVPQADIRSAEAVPAEEGHVAVHRTIGGWGWGALGAVGRMADLCRADVVHIQYQAAAFGMRPAIHALPWFLRSTRRHVRTAVTYHDLRVPYLFPKAGPVRALAVRLLARHADLIVATNGADHADLASHRFRGRLSLVPIGSNIPDAPPPGYDRAGWRAAAGIGPQAAVLAYFGFLNASKGGRGLARALADLRAAGRDARLVMIGGAVGASDPTNAGYLAEFRRDLHASCIADAVHWTGHVPPAEVSAWLHAADVVVLPYADGASYRRGSLLAALAHGRPVVTTVAPTDGAPHAPTPTYTSTSMSTSISSSAVSPSAPAEDSLSLPPLADGQSARLVAPDDAAALTGAIASVLDDPMLAMRLATGARALAANFGWDAIAARHELLYRKTMRIR